MKEVKPLPEEALAEACQILAEEPLLPLLWHAVRNNCFSAETSKEIYARLTEALEENHYNKELLEFYDAIGLTDEVVERHDEAAEKEWKAYDEYMVFMTGCGLNNQTSFGSES